MNFKLLEKLQIFSWFNITPKKGTNRHPWNTILWVHGIRPHGDLRYIPFDRFNSWIYQTSNIKVDRFGVKTIEIGVTFDNPSLLICGKICSHHMENTSYGKNTSHHFGHSREPE